MRKCATFLAVLIAGVLIVPNQPRQATASESPAASGPSVSEFLTPDGRFDLEAVRLSGYEGPIDLDGFRSQTDPVTGEPLFTTAEQAEQASDPDDIYWDNGFAQPGVQTGSVNALASYNGFLIVGGSFTGAGGPSANTESPRGTDRCGRPWVQE